MNVLSQLDILDTFFLESVFTLKSNGKSSYHHQNIFFNATSIRTLYLSSFKNMQSNDLIVYSPTQILLMIKDIGFHSVEYFRS